MKPQPTGSDFAGVGVGLAAAFLVPFFAGLGIDAVAHTGPVFLLIGLALGILSAVVFGYVRFKRFI
ncbi:MAG TPA: AtpZ/AtpI family protein [Candidatus Dormibacteraeota bacterium]